MPVRDRVHNRELFGPWLLRQINSNNFEGVHWLNDDHTLFCVPWKHLNMKSKNEKDYGIFMAWAKESGKYNKHYEDPPAWKRNFRCAINSVMSGNIKMFSEYMDKSDDQQNPHKIYQVNYVQAVPVQPALPVPYSNAQTAPLPEQNMIHNDDEYSLRISPYSESVLPFSVNSEQELDIDALLERFNLAHSDIVADDNPMGNGSFTATNKVLDHGGATYTEDQPNCLNEVQWQTWNNQGMQHQVNNICQNGLTQNAPFVQEVYRVPSGSPYQMLREHVESQPIAASVPHLINGYEASLSETNTHQPSHQQNMQHQIYSACQNVLTQHVPVVEDVCGGSQGPTYQIPVKHDESQHVAHSVPPLTNGFGDSSSETRTQQLSHQQMRFPPLTNWEVTIFYKGKEVLKKNVTKRFLINTGQPDPRCGPADLICFPSTDDLVDQTQINFTTTILNNVKGGFLLEVSNTDYKLYATRFGKSKVYWSLSEDLENSADEKMVPREIQTEIFDFGKYWRELRAYTLHHCRSPDYTIYMSFGQNIDNRIMRKLVLVKLVPQFCVYTHEMVKKQGASSLNQELISLQISTEGSLNGTDQDVFSTMDIDFSCLI
ncbi:interferon regulatory factor 7 isoform X2 [Spea bombifrons]|uniref:interferon regulatory factor 7 isoform X2 n=1 Tax=Spea bombifrons TaxID=233779 RepID=UPI00234A4F38|nr:interferon regulatory factor 7 isoform X2 [Spea bombifrons]